LTSTPTSFLFSSKCQVKLTIAAHPAILWKEKARRFTSALLFIRTSLCVLLHISRFPYRPSHLTQEFTLFSLMTLSFGCISHLSPTPIIWTVPSILYILFLLSPNPLILSARFPSLRNNRDVQPKKKGGKKKLDT
jgi:hypothetical protein